MHDWDANETLILFDARSMAARASLSQANRNGFYYVLDRANGQFLAWSAFAKQTWADGLDAKGRPIVKPGIEPSLEGIGIPEHQGRGQLVQPQL